MSYKFLVCLMALALWPAQANERIGLSPRLDLTVPAPERLESAALAKSLVKLQRRRYSSFNQGILVETLDGSKILAELNSDASFNPASVIKLATSFVALDKFGPDYRFHTAVYGDSLLDLKKKSLPGNLYVSSDGNPVFGSKDALGLGRSLVRKGLRQVDGDLVVAGPFCLKEGYLPQRSAEQLRRLLSRVGIRFKGKMRMLPEGSIDVGSKVHFLSHYSDKLKEILWIQNAHSINEIADRLGDLLGGSEAVRRFLIEAANLDPEDIYVARPSGLDHNRMTPRAGVKILRKMHRWLNDHQLTMQDIMPVAGLDEGTLFGRFRHPDYRGGVVGKTGTNPSKDGGICSLAGLIYTRDQGPLLYAIFNTHGRIRTYRRWQDDFLKDLIEESGGVSEYLEPHEQTDSYSPASWLPSEYWVTLSEMQFSRKPILKKSKSPSRRVVSQRKSPRRTRS